jgi:hypothetical protein
MGLLTSSTGMGRYTILLFSTFLIVDIEEVESFSRGDFKPPSDFERMIVKQPKLP